MQLASLRVIGGFALCALVSYLFPGLTIRGHILVSFVHPMLLASSQAFPFILQSVQIVAKTTKAKTAAKKVVKQAKKAASSSSGTEWYGADRPKWLVSIPTSLYCTGTFWSIAFIGCFIRDPFLA